MTKLNEIYKCEICGNVVEVVNASNGTLVCCGQNMILQEEKSEDEGQEKHVPIVDGLNVKVGEKPHPMEPEHYIQFIEIINESIQRVYLKPSDEPKAHFKAINGKVRAYCNIHGLWVNLK